MLRVTLLLLLVCSQLVQARPVNLDAPSGTLGSSDAMGFVERWEEVQDIDFGGGLTLPFRFGFTSRPERDSTVFGRGWIVPLLDARAVKIDETTVMAELICGKVLYLHCAAEDPTHFQTPDRQWQGLQDGDTFTVSRDDGWMLKYERGHVAELKTDQGRDIVWSYQNDQFVSLDEVGGKPGLELTRDVTGQPDGFLVNGNKYGFTLDRRPMPERVKDQLAVGEMAPSLSGFQWPGGGRDTFKYSLPAPLNVAALDITEAGGRKSKYTWDPQGHILSDGDWTYHVGDQLPDSNLPSLSRTNAAGQTEGVSITTRSGVIVEQNLQGVATTTRLFRTPGPYFNKVRDITETVDGVTRVLERRSYDEAGRLIRSMDRGGNITSYTYDDAGTLVHQATSLDPQVYGQLKQKEAAMLKVIAATPDGDRKNELLQQLATFYLDEMKDHARGLQVAEALPNRAMGYPLAIQAIVYNTDFTHLQRVAEFQKLIPLFPDCTGGLKSLIQTYQTLAQNNRP